MSRIPITSFALVASLVTGCIIHDDRSDDTGDDTTSDAGIGSGSSGGAISPTAGSWYYDEVTQVATTCPTGVNHGEAGDFAIDQIAAASFRVIPVDGTDPFTCSLTGKAFDCPNRASFVQGYPNATVTVHSTATGVFSTASRATGHQDATVDCVGTGCAALAGTAFPCTFKVHFTIAAR